MSIRKPLVIEFTGPPNSGKTTLIKFLRDLLESYGYHVEVKQEDAELVPACIPKKHGLEMFGLHMVNFNL